MESTSSTMRVVALHQRCRVSSRHLEIKEPASVHLPVPANAWRVIPPMAVAEIPVEAVRKVLLTGRPWRRCFRMRDFPVPALNHSAVNLSSSNGTPYLKVVIANERESDFM